MPEQKKFFGCLTRKERWGFSWRGWVLLVVVLALLAGLWVRNVQPFLACTDRVDTKVLVVEGWVHQYVIEDAVREFRHGHYDQVYSTGGPIVGTDGYINDFNTYASVGAQQLVKSGLPAAVVHMAPSRVNGRDRTYSSALALRRYFEAHGATVTNFNILTEDAHARRTRMLFQQAFGSTAIVGVISIPDPDYEPRHWWRYSEGVREILGESIAWFYAEFLFHPEKTNPQLETGK